VDKVAREKAETSAQTLARVIKEMSKPRLVKSARVRTGRRKRRGPFWISKPDDKAAQAERQETNESLATERNNADRGLSQIRAAEEAADRLVDSARVQADAVLIVARDKADQDSEATPIEQAVVEDHRALADAALEGERMTADDRLRREREEHHDALSQLLPLERKDTDRNLLTERVRSDEAIANRDDFLGIVSHDLRNLLGGIVMSVSSLSKNGSQGDEEKRAVAGNRVLLYAARMNRLIGDLVDVTSIDAGHLASKIVSSDPVALIAETLERFRDTAQEKGIELDSQITGVLPRASFDYGRMLQVFANLVANAIKFSPPGGTIRIRAELAGGHVHFSVGDTGIGIPESKFDLIFARFWQASENDRRGTGLGLYISKSIVEGHAGRIWVESTVGLGSVFHFTVPVAPAA
jgi:signal transduction histidine kinase